MSYNPLQKFWDERHNRRFEHRQVQDFGPIPDDFDEGYQYYREFHACFYCGHQEHEDYLTRSMDGFWIHPECNEIYEETQKRLTIKFNLKLGL